MNELSSEARALIRRVGTADGPSPTARAQVKRRIVASLAGAGTLLGGGGTIAAGAPAASLGTAAAGKLSVLSLALWLAAGAGFGAAVSAPALVSAYRRSESARAVTPAAAPLAVPVRAAGGPNEAARAPATAEVAKTVTVEPPVERALDDRPRTAASTGAASLAEETRLLHAAQRELAQKRTSAALALLDEHASRFPRGALAEERSAARVLALCDLGRAREARGAAEAFVRASPNSPLVPRLRDSCALSESKANGNE